MARRGKSGERGRPALSALRSEDDDCALRPVPHASPAHGTDVQPHASASLAPPPSRRVYIEAYQADPTLQSLPTATALADLASIAVKHLADIELHTGRTEPTVVT